MESSPRRLVVLAAGTMGTPVILKRSAAGLGGVPDAVGKHFSPNGDRVSMALMDEERIAYVLGLQRRPGTAYEAFHIGKPIGSMSYDYLDHRRPEFKRFGLQQIYFPSITNLLPEDGHHRPPGTSCEPAPRRWSAASPTTPTRTRAAAGGRATGPSPDSSRRTTSAST